MCGLAGYQILDTPPENAARAIAGFLEHRGPDSSDIWENGLICLIHARLAIQDVREVANQPMHFENLHMVFNGEVYNFLELRDELLEFGYIFNTESDSEVVIKAYHRWGELCFSKFNGMFAIAIYDELNAVMILARDRIGVKPLYYSVAGEKLVFASEIKILLEAGFVNRDIRKQSVADYLKFGYVTNNRTMFDSVYKVDPGCSLNIDLSTLECVKSEYFSWAADERVFSSEAELEEELYDSLVKACEYRLISDVPVGVFLSGGYDSSLVSAICKKLKPDIQTYTIGFSGSEYDESSYAKVVSDHLGIKNNLQVCDISEALSIIPSLANICDDPIADSSIIPTILLSRFARKHVKVVLSADGGDELFAGYEKYLRVTKIWNIFKHIPFRKKIASFLLKLPVDIRSNLPRRSRKLIECLMADGLNDVLMSVSSIFPDDEIKSLLVHDFEKPKMLTTKTKRDNLEQGMLNTDMANYLREDILVKVDRATMSIGLEGREPLLDPELIELCSTIPFRLKIFEGSKKYIFKKIVHKLIPKKIMDREKMGFSVPMSQWLRFELKPLLMDHLSTDVINDQKIFSVDYVGKLVSDFYENRHDDHEKLWTLLMFQLWYFRWIKPKL